MRIALFSEAACPFSDPANSDVPPELFARLSQLAADIVRADATGEGRERWPHYWDADSHRADRCCAEIAIQGAGAFSDPTAPTAVQAIVVWSGESDRLGPEFVEQVSRVNLIGDRDGWRPVPD